MACWMSQYFRGGRTWNITEYAENNVFSLLIYGNILFKLKLNFSAIYLYIFCHLSILVTIRKHIETERFIWSVIFISRSVDVAGLIQWQSVLCRLVITEKKKYYSGLSVCGGLVLLIIFNYFLNPKFETSIFT